MIDRIWSSLAIDTCLRHGVDHVFLAPGSRCTPLTLAVANAPQIRTVQHFDERGLAFAALGYARATGRPGVFICTSGTAVANAFPAVVEASMDGVPMLLFTADRPPELHGTGANQTIDQRRIFGQYVRGSVEIPVPDESILPSFVNDHVAQAISLAADGPVHMNWMFREPFGIGDEPERAGTEDEPSISTTLCDHESGGPHEITIDGDALVVVGGATPSQATAATEMAARLNAPVVADITSGIRAVSPDLPTKLELPTPETIVHIGGRIVSKAWLQYTSGLTHTRFLHLVHRNVVINPNRLDVERYVLPIEQAGKCIRVGSTTSDPFRKQWESGEARRRAAYQRVLDAAGNGLSEPGIAYRLSQMLRHGDGLFLGNSTPIRDMDWFGHWPRERNITVGANRGASGIDGLIAAAVGFAIGLGAPTTCVLGDLSALHDLNSFNLLKHCEIPCVMLVVNNHGGHIFDLLPIAQARHFERYFATPHVCAFEAAASMFQLEYRRVSDLSDFQATYEAALDARVTRVIELQTDRKYNMQIRRQIAVEALR